MPGQGTLKCTWSGCNATFTRDPERQRHIGDKHTGEGRVPCTYPGCDRTMRSDILREHLDSFHHGLREACEYPGCGKSYSTRTLILKHAKGAHPGYKPPRKSRPRKPPARRRTYRSGDRDHLRSFLNPGTMAESSSTPAQVNGDTEHLRSFRSRTPGTITTSNSAPVPLDGEIELQVAAPQPRVALPLDSICTGALNLEDSGVAYGTETFELGYVAPGSVDLAVSNFEPRYVPAPPPENVGIYWPTTQNANEIEQVPAIQTLQTPAYRALQCPPSQMYGQSTDLPQLQPYATHQGYYEDTRTCYEPGYGISTDPYSIQPQSYQSYPQATTYYDSVYGVPPDVSSIQQDAYQRFHQNALINYAYPSQDDPALGIGLQSWRWNQPQNYKTNYYVDGQASSSASASLGQQHCQSYPGFQTQPNFQL